MRTPEIKLAVVEDDPDDQTLILNALKGRMDAEEVRVFRDGIETLAFFSEAARGAKTMPWAILLDLKMPRLDGREVLRRLRASELTRGVPVIVFTSSIEEQDIASCYALGANSYVQKPMDYDEFVRTVRQVVGYWTRLNRVLR